MRRLCTRTFTRFDPARNKYEITQLFEIIESVHLNHCSLVGKKRRKKEGNLDNTNVQRNGISTLQTTCWAWSLLYPSPCDSHHLLLQKPTSAPLEILSDPLCSLSPPAPQGKSSCGVRVGGGQDCLTTGKGRALKRQLKQLLTSCANILSLTLWYSSSLSSIDLLRLSSLNGRILFCWAERKPGGLYKLSC